MNYKLSDPKKILRPDSFCLSDFPDFTFSSTGHARISVIKPSIFFTTTDRTLTVPNDFNLIEKKLYIFLFYALYNLHILGMRGKRFSTFSKIYTYTYIYMINNNSVIFLIQKIFKIKG